MDEPVIRGYRATSPLDVPGLLAATRALGAPVQLVRADRVHGRDHLTLAATLAARAFREGRARTADVPTETALYAAGERQIGKALAFLGLQPETRAVAAVAWGPGAEAALDSLARAQGWARDEAALAGGPHVLDAFGIGAEERAFFAPERWGDLVLERVALVDVLKA